MSMNELKTEVFKLALEEIHRIYGINNPDSKMLRDMIGVVESWPMIQAVLNKMPRSSRGMTKPHGGMAGL